MTESIIEQYEKEYGSRFDADNGENNTMTALLGMVARAMGQSNHRSDDDLAAGIVARYQMSAEGQRQRKADDFIIQLLLSGLSPDDISNLSK